MSLLQFAEGESRKSAIIPLNNKILYSYSSPIVDKYYTSPIFNVLHNYLKLNEEKKNPVLFSSCFPSLDELIFIYETDIRTIYFFGDIENENVVDFLNKFTDFEIIKLEVVNNLT